MTGYRLAAACLGALGAASAIPLALALLDLAGFFNAFDIHAGDTPHGVLVLAGVGGALTLAVAAVTAVGVALTVAGAPAARLLLTSAAIAGFFAAPLLWFPNTVLIGAAAVLLGNAERKRPLPH
jgi:hypothetical protein